MDYQEFLPDRRLASAVHRIWTLTGHAADLGEPLQPVLPDGRPELILHLGDPFDRVAPDGPSERQPAILFAGQVTAPLLLRPTGRIAVIGVRFHPFGAASVLQVPQHELAGQTIGIDEISPVLARRLEDVMGGARTMADIVSGVQECLVGHLDPGGADVRVTFAVREIERRLGRVSIGALARDTALTRRHLERRFLLAVGVTPKRLARIVRFQRALALLEQYDHAPGTQTAAACGYADQAHFIRDFRTLSGTLPSEHLLRQAELTGFFIDGR
jgi:AraC-like DNA-binding protein